MHLIESDPALSRPITDDPSAPNPGAADWFVLIDGTGVEAISATIASSFADAAALKTHAVISTGVYHLMWDLARSDIPVGLSGDHRLVYAALPHRDVTTLILRTSPHENRRSGKNAFVHDLEWL